MMQVVKLEKRHYDTKTKLEQLMEYYECPVCMSLKENIQECRHCHGRSCQECIEDFSRAEIVKNPALKQEGKLKCTICLKIDK